MRSLTRRTVLALCAAAFLPWGIPQLEPANPVSFAAEIERLSEPEGLFDTDNLSSNERSYLDVVPELVSRGVKGGAYVGVGPDQNFSYIARVRPAVAYIIDVRRDNLLLHLLFKAFFSLSRDRAEYVSQLTGRVPPSPSAQWTHATLEDLVSYIDSTPPRADQPTLDPGLEEAIRSSGVPLSPADFETIGRFRELPPDIRDARDGLDRVLQRRHGGRPAALSGEPGAGTIAVHGIGAVLGVGQ